MISILYLRVLKITMIMLLVRTVHKINANAYSIKSKASVSTASRILRKVRGAESESRILNTSIVPEFNCNECTGEDPKVSSNDTSATSETSFPICSQNSSNFVGPLQVIKNVPSEEDLMEKLKHVLGPDLGGLEIGGHWKPKHCISQHRTAIVVPFRNMSEMLRSLLFHLHPILQKHQIEYGIFVVEQSGDQLINPAYLRNIGFVEALKIYGYDCIIFHDTCNLPEDDRIEYKCAENPVFISTAVSEFSYKMPYAEYFGGVVGFTPEQFYAVNGYSNKIWGWGSEDDDIFLRLKEKKISIIHRPTDIYRFTKPQHPKGREMNNKVGILKVVRTLHDTDGLNSLNYTVLEIKKRRLYTWIYVKLPEQDQVSGNQKL